MKIRVVRVNENCHLRSSNEHGISIDMDGSPEIGGKNLGQRPMQVLLSALAGCASMDVIHILQKQQQLITSYSVEVTGERDSKAIPSLFKTIHMHFTFKGELTEKRAAAAISLSLEKYCSVGKALEPTAKITSSYKIEK